jgi:hypothetical protein
MIVILQSAVEFDYKVVSFELDWWSVAAGLQDYIMYGTNNYTCEDEECKSCKSIPQIV